MADRIPNRTKAMRAAGEYWIVMCSNCHHPGGAHIIDNWEPRATHCRCCISCLIYIDGEYGVWSDAKAAEAARITPPAPMP